MRKTLQFIFYVMFAVVVIIGSFILFKSWTELRRMRLRVSDLKQELKRKNDECLELKQNIYDLKTNPHAVEKIAREKFKLCKDNEIIFTYDVKKDKKVKKKKLNP